MKVETIDKILPQGWKTFGSLDQLRLEFNCYEIYFDDTLKQFLLGHPLQSLVKSQLKKVIYIYILTILAEGSNIILN